MSKNMLKFVSLDQQTPIKRKRDNRLNDFKEIYDEFIHKKAAEQSRADALAAKEKETADKQAKGLYGSRSLFGKSGGRGYFDTV